VSWKIEELKSRKFGTLVIKEELERFITSAGKKKRYFLCICDCGKEVRSVLGNLISGNTTRCSHLCLLRERNHYEHKGLGAKYKAEFSSWNHMLGRCYNPKEAGYKRYGGAGVTVCDRWNPISGGTFTSFLEDMGTKPSPKHSINRIGSANIYSPETCEWATKSIQGYDQIKRNTNTSGRTGVSWSEERQKWTAQICIENKFISLGRYESFDIACKIREAAEVKYFGFTKE